MLRCPAGTVTVAGTRATVGLLLVSTTSAPPSGAAEASATVACGCPWPCIDAGATLSPVPDGEGEGLGDGDGDGDGDGATGDPPPALVPPHCAVTRDDITSTPTTRSRCCIRMPPLQQS